jgi:transposase-like protein
VLAGEFETATWLAAGVPAARHTDERALLHLLRASPSSQTGVMRTRRPRPATVPRSTFAGFCFPPELIVVAVRWYLRFALSYRDVEELLTERGVQVDHVTIYRWVQRFTPLLADAARPCRHLVGDRWFVDETYVKVAGRWRYVYRAIDQFGQVIDVFVSARRDTMAAHRFFQRAIGTTKVAPVEVVTDRAATYPMVLEELLPAAWHRTERGAQQSGRSRPWPAEGAAATDARAQAGPQPQSDHRRACIHPERSPWTLRAGGRGASEPASGRGGRRTDLGDLIPSGRGDFSLPWAGATQQCRHTRTQACRAGTPKPWQTYLVRPLTRARIVTLGLGAARRSNPRRV